MLLPEAALLTFSFCMQISDIALEDYIAVKPKFAVYVPHTAGRYQKRRFRKAQCPIVERWVQLWCAVTSSPDARSSGSPCRPGHAGLQRILEQLLLLLLLLRLQLPDHMPAQHAPATQVASTSCADIVNMFILCYDVQADQLHHDARPQQRQEAHGCE